MRNNIFQLY